MIYTKTIAGRQVFSNCTTIQNEDGTWVSNPTEEQIEAAGWIPYVPPVVPDSPKTEPDMELVVEAVKKLLSTESEALSDEDALSVAALFPTWISRVGFQVSVGERLWYDSKLYKVVQAHTAQAEWTPDTTPALFTEVSIEEWPEWVQPLSAADAYNSGDKVAHEDKHWESLVDANVWEPGVYGWSEV